MIRKITLFLFIGVLMGSISLASAQELTNQEKSYLLFRDFIRGLAKNGQTATDEDIQKIKPEKTVKLIRWGGDAISIYLSTNIEKMPKKVKATMQGLMSTFTQATHIPMKFTDDINEANFHIIVAADDIYDYLQKNKKKILSGLPDSMSTYYDKMAQHFLEDPGGCESITGKSSNQEAYVWGAIAISAKTEGTLEKCATNLTLGFLGIPISHGVDGSIYSEGKAKLGFSKQGQHGLRVLYSLPLGEISVGQIKKNIEENISNLWW